MQRFATLELAGHRFRFVDAMSRADFWWTWELSAGVWEPGVIRHLANALREDDVFLDIGAYVGPYALLASRLVGPGGKVYAFEPDPVARGGCSATSG